MPRATDPVNQRLLRRRVVIAACLSLQIRLQCRLTSIVYGVYKYVRDKLPVSGVYKYVRDKLPVCLVASEEDVMPCKITIKCNNPSPNLKTKVSRLFEELGIKCSNINVLPSKNVVIINCISNLDADKIFEPGCTERLKVLSCNAVMPNKLKAIRSIIIKNIDSRVYDLDAGDIKKEIMRNDNSLIIVDLVKFPNVAIIKITFTGCVMVERCVQNGLKAFMISIPPHNIYKYEFIEIKTCSKCFTIKDHITQECKKDPSFKICSKCVSPNHDFKTCTAQIMKCIN